MVCTDGFRKSRDGSGLTRCAEAPESEIFPEVMIEPGDTINGTGSKLSVKASGAGNPRPGRPHGFDETSKVGTETRPSTYADVFSVPLTGSGK